MSGNDGDGVGGSSGGTGDTSCDIELTTTLASPDPTAIATLAVNDVLILVLRESPRSVISQTATGQYVGAITQRAADLARCMQDGWAYTASVTGIAGGAVTVKVAPSS
jgi:hypothetical protein